jgi:hypothetical protein
LKIEARDFELHCSRLQPIFSFDGSVGVITPATMPDITPFISQVGRPTGRLNRTKLVHKN